MIAIGIGCRIGISPEPIVALVERALAQIAIESEETILVSHDRKRSETGLIEAAKLLSLPLIFVSQDAALAADSRSVTKSSHSLETTGLSSFSEAVALAGIGPNARLLLPRIVDEGVACAIARGDTTLGDPT